MRGIIIIFLLLFAWAWLYISQNPGESWETILQKGFQLFEKEATDVLDTLAPMPSEDSPASPFGTSGSETTFDDELEEEKPKKKGWFNFSTPKKIKKSVPDNSVLLFLNNGQTISGKLIDETEDTYFVKYEGSTFEFNHSEVREIKRLGGSAIGEAQSNQVTLYLTNGGAISGELVSETSEKYIVRWQGTLTEFLIEEVERISRGESIESSDGIVVPEAPKEEWVYTHDIIIKMTNGEVMDVAIEQITNDIITFRTDIEGGGYIEQEINTANVEELFFNGIENTESRNIKKTLSDLFPKMQVYEEGNITLFTDSYATVVKKYLKSLRQEQTEIYMQFYPILKSRSQDMQHFVVIFDNPEEYIEFALADGVPGWMAPGYFNPETHVLFLYNMVGDRMQDFIKALMNNVYGGQIDMAVDYIESRVDQRYHVFIEGQAKGFKDKYWEYFDWWLGVLRKTTVMVMRHEFAHEFFSNWKLVAVNVSTLEDDSVKDLEGKKKFLETEDDDEKIKILTELATLRSNEPPPEMKAANSWLAEGLATYCETSPIGSSNGERIFGFQDMMRQNAFFPLGQLTVYKIGSFPGVYHEAMLHAYSQSWALVNFLMHRYPNQFMEYVLKMGAKPPEGDEDLQWLISIIGKDSRTIETELIEYMEQFPEEEDPFMTLIEKRRKLRDSLVNFGHVKA